MDVLGKGRNIQLPDGAGVTVDDNDTLTLDAGVLTHTDGPQRTLYGVGGWSRVYVGRVPDVAQTAKKG